MDSRKKVRSVVLVWLHSTCNNTLIGFVFEGAASVLQDLDDSSMRTVEILKHFVVCNKSRFILQ